MKQLKKRKLDLIPFYPLKSLVVQTPILASVTMDSAAGLNMLPKRFGSLRAANLIDSSSSALF